MRNPNYLCKQQQQQKKYHLFLAKNCKYSYVHHTHESLGVQFIFDNNLITIRGTEFTTCKGKLDIVRDLLLIPYKSHGLWGHFGFLRGAERVLDILVDKDLIDKRFPLVITGHSLGGAVAQALAFFLVKNGFKVDTVVTFGSPTVFYRKLPKELISSIPNITLYENNSDIVSRLPIGEHVVKKLKINKSNKLFSFSGHKIDNYIKELKENKCE